jgi:HK97 family phage prohead protease
MNDCSIKFDSDGGLRLLPAITIKRASQNGELAGYASTFNGDPDAYGDVVAPGAFSRTIAEHQAAKTAPLMLWSHNIDVPIGRWTSMKEDARGLFVEGRINLETTAGRDAYEHLRAGDVNGLSIGFRTYPGGRTYNNDGTATLTAVKLFEISVVGLPANAGARVECVKSIQTRSDLIAALRNVGFSRSEAKRVAAGGWAAYAGHGEEAEAIVEMLRRSAQKLKGQEDGFEGIPDCAR